MTVPTTSVVSGPDIHQDLHAATAHFPTTRHERVGVNYTGSYDACPRLRGHPTRQRAFHCTKGNDDGLDSIAAKDRTDTVEALRVLRTIIDGKDLET
jgi:hypothetical protein